MQWTDKAPTEAGWYWAKWQNGDVVMLRVWQGKHSFMATWSNGNENEVGKITESNVQWWGPLAKPNTPDPAQDVCRPSPLADDEIEAVRKLLSAPKEIVYVPQPYPNYSWPYPLWPPYIVTCTTSKG